MEKEINSLLLEIKTDKVTIRQKAVEKLYEILVNKISEVEKFIRTQDSSSWDDIFRAVNQSIISNAHKLAQVGSDIPRTDKKIILYENLLLKVSDSPANELLAVSYELIVTSILNAFNDDAISKYFIHTYVLLLNQSLKKPNNNFAQVTPKSWSLLLENLFKLIKHNKQNIPYNILFESAKSVIKTGTSFSYLAMELHQFLPTLTVLLESKTNYAHITELLIISYQCCSKIAVENRLEVCLFTEKIAKYVKTVFKSNEKEESIKEILFKLMNLALIVHYPVLNVDKQKMKFVGDGDEWHRQLRNFSYILNTEMKSVLKTKYTINSNVKNEVNQIVVQFAARLSYLIYWDESIWFDQESEEFANVSKRPKVTNKFGSLMDLAQSEGGEINWKWILIIAELVSIFPEALESEYYQPLLQMLSTCQATFGNSQQIYAFAMICHTLLEKEAKFVSQTNHIVQMHCQGLWEKICDATLRSCSSSNKQFIENHLLLQLLLNYQKNTSPNFIEEVIKVFTNKTTVKCDSTLRTLVELMKSYNLDLLDNGSELALKILNYTFEKVSVNERIAAGRNGKPSAALIAEIGAMSCLSKTDVFNFSRKYPRNYKSMLKKLWNSGEAYAYKEEIDRMVNLLMVRSNERFIIEEEDFQVVRMETSEKQEFPKEVKCIMLESMVDELFKLTDFKTKVITELTDIDGIRIYTEQVLENNEMMMCLSDSFLKYEAFNELKFDSSFSTKKIDFNVQEINRLFGLIIAKRSSFELTEKYRMLTLSKLLFVKKYHDQICEQIRKQDLANCLKWIGIQLKQTVEVDNDRHPYVLFGMKEFAEARLDEKIRYLALETLSNYNNCEGVNTQDFIRELKNIESDDEKTDDNIILHSMFEICSIFGRQRTVPEDVVEWIWEFLESICKIHHHNQYISSRLIDNLHNIYNFTQNHSNQICNVFKLYKSYANLISKMTYNPSIAVKFIQQVPKDYFQSYYDEIDVAAIFDTINERLLSSGSFEIRLSSIELLSSILSSDIEQRNELTRYRTTRRQNFKTMLELHEIKLNKIPTVDNSSNLDVTAIDCATSIQLFSTIFSTSFLFRKPLLIELSKTIIKYKLPHEITFRTFNKIIKYLKCGADQLIDSNSLCHLLTHWMQCSYSLEAFPWHFVNCNSFEKFVKEKYKTILLIILKTRPQIVENFSKQCELEPKRVVQDLLPECISFLLPIDAGCTGIKYGSRAIEMKRKIDVYITANEMKSSLIKNVPKIINCILENVHDRAKFNEVAGFDLEILETPDMITFDDLETCIACLTSNFTLPHDQSLITFFCDNNKFCNYIEKILTTSKSRILETNLREHRIFYLIQYCIFIEMLYEYLKCTTLKNDIKGFLIRDIVSFLCFLIDDNTHGLRMKEVATNFLRQFLWKILPICVDEVKPFLNTIVFVLMNSVFKCKEDIKTRSQEILKFLCVTHKNEFETEICELDEFPDRFEFNDLRKIQQMMKQKRGEINLVEEIMNFLKNKNRRVEGLVTLRKSLACKKLKLKQIYIDLSKTLGFTEDGEENLLHKLIRVLIHFIRHSHEDPERAVEAVKCLGEIGAYDLATMTFLSDEHQKSKMIYEKFDSFNECQMSIFTLILEMCDKLLINEKPEILKSASKICYHIMEFPMMMDHKLNKYLLPFNTNTVSRSSIFSSSFSSNEGNRLNLIEILRSQEFVEYDVWIRRIASKLLDFLGDKTVKKLAKVHHLFAESMVPMILKLILFYNNESVNKEIAGALEYFFEKSAEKINYLVPNDGSIFINKLALRLMLKCVESIRSHCIDHCRSKIKNNFNVNFLNVAKCARYCEAYFSAVMYCELYAQTKTTIEKVSPASIMQDKSVEEVMYESFKAIGVQDAANLFINPSTNRDLYLQVQNLQLQSILEHSVTVNSTDQDLSQLFYDLKLYKLSQKFSEKKMNFNQYECLWRMADWTVVVDTDPESKDIAAIDFNEEFEKFHYCSLKSLKNRDEFGVKTSLSKARNAIIQLIQLESLECTQNLYKFLVKSQLLSQIEDFATLRFTKRQDVKDSLIENWTVQNDFPQDYKLIKLVLAQRSCIFQTADIRTGQRTWIPEQLQSNMLNIVQKAMDSDMKHDAIMSIAMMRSIEGLTTSNKAELLLKEAQLNLQNNYQFSEYCLKKIMNDSEFKLELFIKSVAYRCFGQLLAEKTGDFENIYKKYMKPSIVHLEKYCQRNGRSHLVVDIQSSDKFTQSQSQPEQDENSSIIDKKIMENVCVFEIVARYWDQDYVSKSNYMKSTFHDSKLQILAKNKHKLEEIATALKDPSNKNKDLDRSHTILKRSVQCDELELNNEEKSLKKSGRTALFYYLRSILNIPNENALAIFRVISIWLEDSINQDFIYDMISSTFPKVPSWKFLVAFPQLVVRINEKLGSEDKTNGILMDLLERCAVDHPHHTLQIILALVNSYKDYPVTSKVTEEPRVIGARNLWRRLKQNERMDVNILDQMEKSSAALIQLANETFIAKLPASHPLTKLKNLSSLQCPTVELLIKKDCKYEKSITSIVKWSSSIRNVGGINAPKKIYCVCLDGIERPQLLKGKDDMRQDAVMQQVFGVVNQFLRASKDMNRTRIRTYKVIPFSRRSGILEWCINTMPIGMYLLGDPNSDDPVKREGAHAKYNPNDWTTNKCLKKIHENDRAEAQKKEEVFNEICQNIHPAFQHFFYERFKNPGEWFERRLVYTTSVAVNSMVGYILGIGDRHVQNILIDVHTAEIIHIDFGIAFELGKILPHPELVPFRLTRDIVAPMGVCGVDGVFRKTCEKSIRILRENEKTLTTILEVLLYDPMYSWTLTTNQARNRQMENNDGVFDLTDDESEDNVERNSMASRALQRVQTKLKGADGGSSRFSTVEFQVESLIQDAMNPSYLSKLFKGWQAYL